MGVSDPLKCVWVASMPRSGSMWVFNVARSVLREGGKEVLPREVPQSDEEMLARAEQAVADTDPNRVWVLKVHRRVAPGAPGSRFINTSRDLRDALISFMRFMACDFDIALSAMAGSAELTEYYATNFEPRSILRVNYDDIVRDPVTVVGDIAHFCNVQVESSSAMRIAKQFDKASVQRLVKQKEKELQCRVAAGEAIPWAEVVVQRYRPDEVRAFDLTTGFQTGHVSNYRDGDWRRLLTPEQQRRMHDVLGQWLQRNGYPEK